VFSTFQTVENTHVGERPERLTEIALEVLVDAGPLILRDITPSRENSV